MIRTAPIQSAAVPGALAASAALSWNIPRSEMTDGRAILRRMTAEAVELLATRGADDVIAERDFYLAGWDHRQIQSYGPQAVEAALAAAAAARAEARAA